MAFIAAFMRILRSHKTCLKHGNAVPIARRIKLVCISHVYFCAAPKAASLIVLNACFKFYMALASTEHGSPKDEKSGNDCTSLMILLSAGIKNAGGFAAATAIVWLLILST